MSIISPLLLLAVVLMTGSQANPQHRPVCDEVEVLEDIVEVPAIIDDPICAFIPVAKCNEVALLNHCPNKCGLTCPVGYWSVPKASKLHCYKLFTGRTLSFGSALSTCSADGGAHLAYPLGEDNPVTLRAFIVKTFGHQGAWLGARGTGEVVSRVNDKGVPTGVTVTSSSHYWMLNNPYGKTGPSYCLMMVTDQNDVEDYPDKTFEMAHCCEKHLPLCQKPAIHD